MAQTHDLGNYFVHTVRLKLDSPIVHRAVTNEIEEPYRTSHSWIVRVPKTTKGLVFGHWMETGRSENAGLQIALRGNLARGLSQDKYVGEFDFSEMPGGVSDSELGRLTLRDYTVNRDTILKNSDQFRNTDEELAKVRWMLENEIGEPEERALVAEMLGLDVDVKKDNPFGLFVQPSVQATNSTEQR